MLQEASGAAGHPSYRRYHYGNGPLLVEDGGTRRFISTDALGSTTDLTGSGGAVASMRKYDAWGQYRNDTAPLASEPKLGFTGHQYDPETGLVYARARYYDAEMGRFISRDVNEGSIANAPSLHRYSYAHGNPTVYVDKDGRSATAVGFVGGFFWGFEQMAQGMVSDIWHGRVRDTSDYLSVWGQNIVAGTEIGASIDVAIASGGIAASSVSGGLGFAGISALTASGEAKDWSKFGDTQVVEGGKGLLAGAALGAVVKAGGVAVQAAARTQSGQAVARVASKAVGAAAETEAGQVIAKAATTAAEKVGGLLRRAGAGADEAVEELLGAGNVAQLPSRAGKALGEAEEKVGDFIVQAWKEARTPWAAPEPVPAGTPVADAIWGPHNGPGPLGAKVAETFRSATYREHILDDEVVLYRAYGGKAGPTSPYWSRTRPAGPLQATLDNALLPEWGNTATEVSTIRVPAGTRVYDGAIAPQVGTAGLPSLLGGGSQVYIPKVNPAWLVNP